MGFGDNALESDNFVVKNSEKPEEMKTVTKISKEDIQAKLKKREKNELHFRRK